MPSESQQLSHDELLAEARSDPLKRPIRVGIYDYLGMNLHHHVRPHDVIQALEPDQRAALTAALTGERP